ncbi:tyrosine-type recombinase/integrase [Bacillus andreraoultii]|uniref:tyrosine-type recombinase/integrase n=1 Tax=Bacillus andreraoultii TaxID=1499685 RepID=UPI000539AD72|nr:tyrosine-type recombinase/integrase [Bacillus andreraoultii]
MTNENLIELFVEKMNEKGKSNNTIKNYVADVKNYVKWLGVQQGDTPADAPKKTLKKYIQHLESSGLASSTVNRRIQTLRTFYQTLIELGIREDDPTEGIKSKKIAKQNDTKWLERHQVKAIFEAIDKQKQGEDKRFRERAIISVLVNCGLRVSELCDLKMDDLDFKGGFMNVIGKGGKFRRVPFNPATQRAVKQWLQFRSVNTPYVFHTERSEHMTPRAVQHIVKKLADSLNFTFTVHQLRHTALKNIADTTGKIEIVATVAGHESVNTSKRYIEPSLKEIGEAMKQTEYDF